MSIKDETERVQLLQGTLDLLILETLRLAALHDHEIVKAIERRSDAVLLVEQGSLYPALHRLIKSGWITLDPGTSENNRHARFYRLTARAGDSCRWKHGSGNGWRAPSPAVLRPA